MPQIPDLPVIFSAHKYGQNTMPSTSLFLVLGLFVISGVCRKVYTSWMPSKSLPPSPPKHLIGQQYQHVLLGTKYKQEFGNIISTSTLTKTNIYLNTMELVTELLDKHASVTADRPSDVMTNDLLGYAHSPVFRNHDEVQKKMRRVMASALRSTVASSYASQYLDTTLGLLREVAADPSSFMKSIDTATGAFTMRLAYGYTPKTQNDPMLFLVRDALRHLMIATNSVWLVNYLPLLRYVPSWLPGAGFQKIAQRGAASRMRYADTMYDKVLEQVRTGTIEQPSYASGLLESKGGANANSDDTYLIKWTSASIFTAGATTSTVIKSFILMACLYPEAAKKAQVEIDSAVGRERIPNLQDRPELPYTEAFLQEVMRMFPSVPLGVPHLSTENIDFQGYQIPKGSIIEPNIWALLRDPNHFSCPHVFNPSRFLGPKPELDPRKFIFGFGRRVCPGLHVANNGTWVTCAGLLSVFDIQAGLQLEAKVLSLGGRESERLYELTEPFWSCDPLPFDCEIKPRDSAALSVLNDSSK